MDVRNKNILYVVFCLKLKVFNLLLLTLCSKKKKNGVNNTASKISQAKYNKYAMQSKKTHKKKHWFCKQCSAH
jgi:hypothetical protein